MKVKFANRIYEVLFTKELAGLTMYAVEDEPNHVDWLINVEVIDDEKEELKKIEQKNEIDIPFIEIPFGAKDSELIGANYHIPEGFHAEIKGNRVFIKKGEQKPAWSEEDEERLQSCVNILQAKGLMGVTETINTKWLNSLKDRCLQQPKQEWSEEDDIMVENVRNSFGLHCGQMTETLKEQYDKFFNKVKSLRPQSHWKPSDEQIIALRWVLNNIPYNKHKEEISGLLDQIKEL